MISRSFSFVLLASSLNMSLCGAAVLNISNLTWRFEGNDLAFFTSSGTPVATTSPGFVALHTFVGGPPTDAAALRRIGDTGQIAAIVFAPGNSPGDGLFASAFQYANDGRFTGIPLYLIVGSGGLDLGSAAEVALIETGLAGPPADGPPPPWSQDLMLDANANILIGSVGSATVDWSLAGEEYRSYQTHTLQLVPVDPGHAPEPSVPVFLGLAAALLCGNRTRQTKTAT